MSQEKQPVTVIVPVKNEAKNIAQCLRTLQWAEKLYVVDSNSDDSTCSIASAMGAEVVQFHYEGGWPKKKNWALRTLRITTPWVLIIDADERIAKELQTEIADAIRREDVDGFYVRWKFMFLGRWMKHSWNHGWMLRLFRTGMGEYEDLGMRGEGGWDNEVHENIVVNGRTDILRNFLTHDSNEPLHHWINKQNQFSTWNAVRRTMTKDIGNFKLRDIFARDPLQRRRAAKGIYLRMPMKPILMFLYLYILKRGFLDGREGLYFCALRASHELNTSAKVFEMRRSTPLHQ